MEPAQVAAEVAVKGHRQRGKPKGHWETTVSSYLLKKAVSYKAGWLD